MRATSQAEEAADAAKSLGFPALAKAIDALAKDNESAEGGDGKKDKKVGCVCVCMRVCICANGWGWWRTKIATENGYVWMHAPADALVLQTHANLSISQFMTILPHLTYHTGQGQEG